MIDRPFMQGSSTSLQASCLIDANAARAKVLAALQAHPGGQTRLEGTER